MCLAIWFVRTGVGMVSFLKPKYDPTNTRGVLTPIHSRSSSARVPTGVAVDEPYAATKELMPRNMAPMSPGYSTAVSSVFCFQFLPEKSL